MHFYGPALDLSKNTYNRIQRRTLFKKVFYFNKTLYQLYVFFPMNINASELKKNLLHKKSSHGYKSIRVKKNLLHKKRFDTKIIQQ